MHAQRPISPPAANPIISNTTKMKLAHGELVLGFGVYHLRSAATPLIARSCGYDWLFILGEHGSFSTQETAQLCLSALATGLSPIVQIHADAMADGARALDNGAQGIIVPHVDTAEQARAVVDAFRYPPVGRRSWGGPPALFGFRPPDMGTAQKRINDETLLVAMIETAEGIANIEAISAIEGLDVLLVGAGDLSADLGIPGEVSHARIHDAIERTAQACRRHGKVLGLGGVYEPALQHRYIALGARFILAGSDQSFLMAAATARAQDLRAAPIRG